MVELANIHHPTETGGILLGYVATNGEGVVSEIIGPGPNAKHSRSGFSPDHSYQVARLEKRFNETGGLLDYLGDWHTHPDGCNQMSRRDRRTLAKIGRTTRVRLPNPFMLILSLEDNDWKPGIYYLVKLPTMRWQPSTFQRICIALFNNYESG